MRDLVSFFRKNDEKVSASWVLVYMQSNLFPEIE